MMKLLGKDFKTAFVNILEDLKGNMNVMSREIEYIKYNEREFLELKNTLSKFFKKSLNGLINRLETIKEILVNLKT